jgi:hypothetical protein
VCKWVSMGEKEGGRGKGSIMMMAGEQPRRQYAYHTQTICAPHTARRTGQARTLVHAPRRLDPPVGGHMQQVGLVPLAEGEQLVVVPQQRRVGRVGPLVNGIVDVCFNAHTQSRQRNQPSTHNPWLVHPNSPNQIKSKQGEGAKERDAPRCRR